VLTEISGADGGMLKHSAVGGLYWRGYLRRAAELDRHAAQHAGLFYLDLSSYGGAGDFGLTVAIQ
jgi:hypothetical protein